MKGPSKLDQLRALREAAPKPRSPRVGDTVVYPDGEVRKILAQTSRDLGPALKRLAESGDTVSDTVTPWLAPEGRCASCDKRRAALNATMRKRRAAEKAAKPQGPLND